MARAKISYQHTDPQGNVVINTKAKLYQPGTDTEVTALYDAPTGGNLLTTPLVANEDGYIEAWLDAAQDVELVVTDDTDFHLHDSDQRPYVSAGEQEDLLSILSGTFVAAQRVPWLGTGIDHADVLEAAVQASGEGKHVVLDDNKTYTVSRTIQVNGTGRTVRGGGHTFGTRILFTGTGPLFQLGTDNGSAHDANQYDGPEGFVLADLTLEVDSPATPCDTASYGNYKPGTYAVRDWRGGSVGLERVKIRSFDYWFWGVQSDLNTWSELDVQKSHSGAYLGPRSDQLTVVAGHFIYNDRVFDVDSAQQARFLGCSFVNNGDASTAPIRLRAAYARGCHGTAFDNCWFEHYLGAAEVVAFIDFGVGDAIASQNLVIRNATMMTNDNAGPCHAKYLVRVGNATAVVIEEVANPGAYGLEGIVSCVGTTSPSILYRAHANYANHARLQVVNNGTGTPVTAKWSWGDGILGAGSMSLGVAVTATALTGTGGVTSGSNGAAGTTVGVNAAAGSARMVEWRTAGVSRWQLRADTATEAGSNAGSLMDLVARSDAGTSLGTVYSIDRRDRVLRLTKGVGLPVKAGAWSDADFDVAPPNGTMCLNSTGGTNGQLMIRNGGTWRTVNLV